LDIAVYGHSSPPLKPVSPLTSSERCIPEQEG
jgi:hypothetical protein